MKRRDFIASCTAAAAGLGIGRASAQAKVPVLGLIFPPLNRGVPEEGIAMYGDRLKYVVTGLGVEQMTPEGFNAHGVVLAHGTEALVRSHQALDRQLVLRKAFDDVCRWPGHRLPTRSPRRRTHA